MCRQKQNLRPRISLSTTHRQKNYWTDSKITHPTEKCYFPVTLVLSKFSCHFTDRKITFGFPCRFFAFFCRFFTDRKFLVSSSDHELVKIWTKFHNFFKWSGVVLDFWSLSPILWRTILCQLWKPVRPFFASYSFSDWRTSFDDWFIMMLWSWFKFHICLEILWSCSAFFLQNSWCFFFWKNRQANFGIPVRPFIVF